MKQNEQGYIIELEENEVIVVGTNALGMHGGGAARQAHEQFGLIEGIAWGQTGQTYAFCTLNKNFERLSNIELQEQRDKLYRWANNHQEKTFFLTAVGTGIAGIPKEEMDELFKELPKNIIKICSTK
jgi:O-acetyl-ADP-ribose deacetylase (regulator of RNase III)